MNEKMTELQRIIELKKITNFKFSYYKDFILKVVGSLDSDYYHNIDITFYGVSFLSCPTQMIDVKIRLGTNKEYEWLLQNHKISYLEDEDILFCFTTKDDSDKYFIFGENFNFIVQDVEYEK
ncbi:hypothetical protein [Clostridium sp. CH2]|uniref:hypothetical protein n=1 Tax=Clostridium sp. CH2 TaxID=2949990 RepID=UPI00207AB892|nr:hypothetical protein [Clostridium sp. CH2]